MKRRLGSGERRERGREREGERERAARLPGAGIDGPR